MRKLKVFLAVMCLAATVGTQTAFAANTPYSFTFSSINNVQNSANGTKDDNDSNWYITLDRTNASTGVSNTLSSSNIFGVKIHRTVSDTVGTYATFSNYVSSYGLKYASSVKTGDNMYLKGQKDDASTSSAALRISGRFAP